MEVSIIFKIAAVGILVSVLSQVLKHSGREEQAFFSQPGRSPCGTLLDRTIYFMSCLTA